jgi:hypothetical protein
VIEIAFGEVQDSSLGCKNGHSLRADQ